MLGNNIQRIREEKGMKLNETARLAGISGSYLSNIERGIKSNPSMESLKKIAEALGAQVEDFFKSELVSKEKLKEWDEKFNKNGELVDIVKTIGNDIKLTEAQKVFINDFVPIPILGVIRAGIPIMASENIEGFLPVSKWTLYKDKEYFCLKVKGDSMNLEFQEGSILLIEKTPCVENGEIGIVLIDGMDATVKKIVKNENMITLIPASSNPIHIPKMYDMIKDQIKILGKVKQASKMY